jgi:hypothetical protein
MKQGWWCAALLWFLSLCLVLEYFSTVLPNSYLWKQELSDVLLFVIPFFVFGLKIIFNSPTQFLPMKAGMMCYLLIPFFTFGLKVFFNSLPNFYLWSRDWVMCCSFVIPFFGLKVFFNSPTIPTYESRDWVMCCSFVIPFFVFGLSIFNSPTQFLPMKAGIEWCAALLWFLYLRLFAILVLRVFSTWLLSLLLC